MTSEIKEAAVPSNVPDYPAAPESPHGPNMPVSPLHGNNAPKSDVVFMITEGQSRQVKLDPIVIDKQKPAQKKKKKKKKGTKVNKVNASDEDIEDVKTED
ncbi:Hypp7929 [Branchiostoma lanceolatum]|uniref:Hypp7929 protein n=1 Tax=Branchiostoma lanceolatum TaxID=7740 RepID=A0A8J9Z4D4_BRALA|nr:Hypp7929 [Branchiostoma lanceolatum]